MLITLKGLVIGQRSMRLARASQVSCQAPAFYNLFSYLYPLYLCFYYDIFIVIKRGKCPVELGQQIELCHGAEQLFILL